VFVTSLLSNGVVFTAAVENKEVYVGWTLELTIAALRTLVLFSSPLRDISLLTFV